MIRAVRVSHLRPQSNKRRLATFLREELALELNADWKVQSSSTVTLPAASLAETRRTVARAATVLP